jgi:hypothetical protein
MSFSNEKKRDKNIGVVPLVRSLYEDVTCLPLIDFKRSLSVRKTFF